MDDRLTFLIRSAAKGDPESQEKAAELVYQELKQTADWLMRNEANNSLQPTALVNQVIVQLFDTEKIAESPNRKYFFGAAARSMKQIILDEAKRRKAQKRGGAFNRRPFDAILDHYERQGLEIESLHEALEQLEKLHPRQSDVVHMKWFLDFTTGQIAEALGVSATTVENDWRIARAFLHRHLKNT